MVVVSIVVNVLVFMTLFLVLLLFLILFMAVVGGVATRSVSIASSLELNTVFAHETDDAWKTATNEAADTTSHAASSTSN